MYTKGGIKMNLKSFIILFGLITSTFQASHSFAQDCSDLIKSDLGEIHAQNLHLILSSTVKPTKTSIVYIQDPTKSQLNEMNKEMAEIYELVSSEPHVTPYMLESITERLVKKRVYFSREIGKKLSNYSPKMLKKFPYFIYENHSWLVRFNLDDKNVLVSEID